MNPTPFITTPKLLTVAAVVELATGLALLFTPGLVSRLLLGIAGTEVIDVFARFFGLALVALGIACWPRPVNAAAVRAMLVYNGLIALYLAYLGVVVSSGLLLWPAVVFHAVMTMLLLRR
jgi:hypothetical protein